MPTKLIDSAHGHDLAPYPPAVLSLSSSGAFGSKTTMSGGLLVCPEMFQGGLPWTIEMRVTCRATGTTVFKIMDDGGLGTGAFAAFQYGASLGSLNSNIADGRGGAYQKNYTSPGSNPYVLAVEFDGNRDFYVFINGTYDDSQTITHQFGQHATLWSLVLGPNTDADFDEIRVSNSFRYDVSAPVPTYVVATAPFTVDGNTVALYHCD